MMVILQNYFFICQDLFLFYWWRILVEKISSRGERLMYIMRWYTETEATWKLFEFKIQIVTSLRTVFATCHSIKFHDERVYFRKWCHLLETDIVVPIASKSSPKNRVNSTNIKFHKPTKDTATEFLGLKTHFPFLYNSSVTFT